MSFRYLVLICVGLLISYNGLSNGAPITQEPSGENSSPISNTEEGGVVVRNTRHLFKRKFGQFGGNYGPHHPPPNYGGSFASASAGSFGSGGGHHQSNANAHSASFSVGPFTASFASSFAHSGGGHRNRDFGFFDY